VARRAGVAKGTLFVYFESKEELFTAAVRTVLADYLDWLQLLSDDADRPLGELVTEILAHAADIENSRVPQIMRLLIGESRTFPELIRVWHSEVASHAFALMTVAIERAQARNEVRPGNALLHAFSILGPMIAATLFREVFQNTDANLPELHALARQHADTILQGLVIAKDSHSARKRR
jgi:AcrR family transcriptional regulator